MDLSTKDDAKERPAFESDSGAAPVSRRAFVNAALTGVASAAIVPIRVSSGQRDAPLTDIATASATRIAASIRRREVSCVEACIAHVHSINPQVNAVVQLSDERALAEARARDRSLARREPAGPLHGVPITIKDSFDVADVISTAGTTGRRAMVPRTDATAVARMRAAGAIVLGKTNCSELTLSYETDNLVYGRTSNPYDTTRTAGGSSGGAAAILAAGGVFLDIGSDTGGSIRIPSHFCGIAGIKPTSGRVPRTGHIIPAQGVLQAFTQIGPMARFVEDLILALPIIAGPDWRDASVVPATLRDPHTVSLRGLRIAVHSDNGIFSVSEPCARATDDAARVLAAAGCVIEHQRPPDLSRIYEAGNRLWRAAGPATVRRLLAAAGTTDVSPPLRPWLSSAVAGSPEDWTAIVEHLDELRGQMLSFLLRYDAILCPPCAIPAPEHGATLREDLDAAFSYSEVYNYSGWPAVVVRVGTTRDRLPVGVQVVATPWREDVALALALRLEADLGGWKPSTRG